MLSLRQMSIVGWSICLRKPMSYSHSLSREERASLTLCGEPRTDKFRQKTISSFVRECSKFLLLGFGSDAKDPKRL